MQPLVGPTRCIGRDILLVLPGVEDDEVEVEDAEPEEGHVEGNADVHEVEGDEHEEDGVAVVLREQVVEEFGGDLVGLPRQK